MDGLLLELSIARQPDIRRRLAALLAPLDAGPDLRRTLDVLFACDLDRERTASELYIHRRTLRYRLDRIKSLSGIDPHSARGIQLLRAALTADRLPDLTAPDSPSSQQDERSLQALDEPRLRCRAERQDHASPVGGVPHGHPAVTAGHLHALSAVLAVTRLPPRRHIACFHLSSCVLVNSTDWPAGSDAPSTDSNAAWASSIRSWAVLTISRVMVVTLTVTRLSITGVMRCPPQHLPAA
jgi:hypothetical protein